MKRFLKPAIIYAILFSIIGLYSLWQDEKVDVRLEILRFEENGSVTLALKDYGCDVEYLSQFGGPGDREILYQNKYIAYQPPMCCTPPLTPPRKVLKRGKGIEFTIYPPYMEPEPWRYTVDVCHKNGKPEWMRKAYESAFNKVISNENVTTLKSRTIWKGQFRE